MQDERRGQEEEQEQEAFPAGERAAGAPEPSGDEETFPAGVETDEGQRPDDKLEDEQPGMLDDPPRAD